MKDVERIPLPQFDFVDDGSGNRRMRTMPSPTELQAFYAQLFDRVSYERRGKSLQGWHRARRIRSLMARHPRGSLLDFGAGNGQFLSACRRAWPEAELSACEFPSPQLQAVATRIHARVFPRYLKSFTRGRVSM